MPFAKLACQPASKQASERASERAEWKARQTTGTNERWAKLCDCASGRVKAPAECVWPQFSAAPPSRRPRVGRERARQVRAVGAQLESGRSHLAHARVRPSARCPEEGARLSVIDRPRRVGLDCGRSRRALGKSASRPDELCNSRRQGGPASERAPSEPRLTRASRPFPFSLFYRIWPTSWPVSQPASRPAGQEAEAPRREISRPSKWRRCILCQRAVGLGGLGKRASAIVIANSSGNARWLARFAGRSLAGPGLGRAIASKRRACRKKKQQQLEAILWARRQTSRLLGLQKQRRFGLFAHSLRAQLGQAKELSWPAELSSGVGAIK